MPAEATTVAKSSDDPFLETLVCCWEAICTCYGVVGDLPKAEVLFAGTDAKRSYAAAETVVVNMLLEVMERVDRFSPWYTKPAKAFNLVTDQSRPVRWRLDEQGYDRWWHLVDVLAPVMEQNHNLIGAMILVDRFMDESTPDEPRVAAVCRCAPPRTIQVKRSILDSSRIICESCGQPFQPGS